MMDAVQKTRMLWRIVVCLILLALAVGLTQAQQPEPATPAVEQGAGGEEGVEVSPSRPRWNGGSGWRRMTSITR